MTATDPLVAVRCELRHHRHRRYPTSRPTCWRSKAAALHEARLLAARGAFIVTVASLTAALRATTPRDEEVSPDNHATAILLALREGVR